MVTNGEYIKKWLSDMKIKKFTVWKSDKGTINRNNGFAFASKDDESTETNIENFFDWCGNNSGCYVLTQAEGNANNAELEFCLPFKKAKAEAEQLTAGQQALQGVQITGISEREFETRLENEKLKMKLERLEDELKEAKESSGAQSEFFKTLTPFVGPVLQGLLSRKGATIAAPAPAQVGATDPEEVGGLDIPEQEFKQLTEDLTRWSEADPDYLQLIHKISLLTADPMYQTAKQLISNR